jgi:hypothetical protein
MPTARQPGHGHGQPGQSPHHHDPSSSGDSPGDSEEVTVPVTVGGVYWQAGTQRVLNDSGSDSL